MELSPAKRIASIDILRGIVMVIMALDHTREFFHRPAFQYDPLDLSQTTPAIFMARWVTHFCAPVFVFLSGVSAFLSSQRKTKREASLFLIKRGLWLVFVEMAIVTLGITFNPFYNFILWQVIWAIGWSMVILGILMRLSDTVVLVAGLTLVFGHNILDYTSLPATGTAGTLWNIFFRATFNIIPLGPDRVIADAYAILPWTGVMLLGYSIGRWFSQAFPPGKRKQLLLGAGFFLVGLFIVLRFTGLYGNPSTWQRQDSLLNNILAFIDTNKYPPSLLYLCMTLGPTCIFLALTENAKARWTGIVSVYGRVPFFYYILHFYLLHLLLVIVFFATGHGTSEIITPPFLFRPVHFGFGLAVVCIIWIGVVAILYLPCRWFHRYKKTHKQWWLSYI